MLKLTIFNTTKAGVPYVTEYGGATKDTKSVVLWCDENGEPLMAFHLPAIEAVENGSHAFFPLSLNMYKIELSGKYKDEKLVISQLKGFEKDLENDLWHGAFEIILNLNTFDDYAGDNQEYLYKAAIQTVPHLKTVLYSAFMKGNDYLCKKAYYIKNSY
jgi:hypothetical protein